MLVRDSLSLHWREFIVLHMSANLEVILFFRIITRVHYISCWSFIAIKYWHGWKITEDTQIEDKVQNMIEVQDNVQNMSNQRKQYIFYWVFSKRRRWTIIVEEHNGNKMIYMKVKNIVLLLATLLKALGSCNWPLCLAYIHGWKLTHLLSVYKIKLEFYIK